MQMRNARRRSVRLVRASVRIRKTIWQPEEVEEDEVEDC